MRKMDRPEDMLAEAIRLDAIATVSGKAGDFATASYMRRESEWFLNYAANLEAGRPT